MIGELDISGVFLPTLLVMMFGTYLLFLGVHAVLVRLHFYRLVWHRALFNVAPVSYTHLTLPTIYSV